MTSFEELKLLSNTNEAKNSENTRAMFKPVQCQFLKE